MYSVQFNHHPLFSPEHVLAQKLKEFYEKFLEKKRTNKYITLEKNLKALICAKKRLKDTLGASGDATNLQIDKYQTEINEIRLKRYEEGRSYRELLKSILNTWRMIKIVRDEQNYVNTPLKLVIKKEIISYKNAKEQWENNIEEEVSDIIEQHEIDFHKEIDEYKSKVKEWKVLKRRIAEEDEDELPEKPKKPQRQFDIQKITEEVIIDNNKRQIIINFAIIDSFRLSSIKI